MKPFVTSMTILPDQSCSTAPTSLKATDPTANRMISALTASATVAGVTLGPISAATSASVSGPRELAMRTGMSLAAKNRASVAPTSPVPMMAYVMLISILIVAENSVRDRDQRGTDLRRDLRGERPSAADAVCSDPPSDVAD